MADSTAESYIALAKTAGFTHASSLDVTTLRPNLEVRDACATDKCGKYNACWTCPPGCGTLDTCTARIQTYSTGLIVQTVGTLEDSLDYESMQVTMEKHIKTFADFAQMLRETLKRDVLALGSGGCSICKTCSYPDAPCLFPERAFSSMEAYGLLVTDVCRENGLSYYYGPNTISYTSCCLWKQSGR